MFVVAGAGNRSRGNRLFDAGYLSRRKRHLERAQ